jgi:uncharacterized membrane protein
MKHPILLLIFIICFIASAILAFIPPEEACGGTQTSCYVVSQSGYEETIGINNSYLGLIAFGLLSILTLSNIKEPKKYKHKLIIFGIIAGSIFAIYYLYLQIFIIKALCKYCIVIDSGILLSLILLFAWKKK